MTGSNKSGEAEATSPRESGEDSEDDIEILEESPCGRWSKRRQEVSTWTLTSDMNLLSILKIFLNVKFTLHCQQSIFHML